MADSVQSDTLLSVVDSCSFLLGIGQFLLEPYNNPDIKILYTVFIAQHMFLCSGMLPCRHKLSHVQQCLPVQTRTFNGCPVVNNYKTRM